MSHPKIHKANGNVVDIRSNKVRVLWWVQHEPFGISCDDLVVEERPHTVWLCSFLTPVVSSLASNRRILILGDSYTVGYGDAGIIDSSGSPSNVCVKIKDCIYSIPDPSWAVLSIWNTQHKYVKPKLFVALQVQAFQILVSRRLRSCHQI